MDRSNTEKLLSFNKTEVPFPFVPVHEQIHRQAQLHPDKTAVISCDRLITYSELDALSDRIALVLIQKTSGMNELISVLFEREAMAYAAEIAVLKAGAAFLPFIPEYPDARIDYCMSDSGSRLLLTTKKLREARFLRPTEYEVLAVEDILIYSDQPNRQISLPRVPKTHLAYCIYTSGTTGRPKGVLIEHRSIANYVHRNEKSIDVMQFASPGRISLAIAPFSFDFSLEEELVPLCNGNTVVIATNEQIHDPVRFAEIVLTTGTDAIACTPSYLCGLLSARESREALKQFRLFHIGAEAFPKQLYARLRKLRKDSVIMNVYGPTECCIISSSSVITDDEVITVGSPRANVQYHVLDRSGNTLPVGQKGELIISGSQVARGYIRQNAPDGPFFTYQGSPAYHTGDLASWTDTGEIVLHGRIDSQIKLHGFRIEPNEIEAVTAEYPGIQSAAVALKKGAHSEYLAGYYTSEGVIDRSLLKRFIREKLPYYMVPNVLMRIEKMPVSTNGKLDRSRLPEPSDDDLGAGYIPPGSGQEVKLCAAFEKVLNRPEHSVGLMDDFFDLSGDSLSAMELLSEADIKGLTYSDIFTFRTPAEILSELARRDAAQQVMDFEQLEKDALLSPHMVTPVQRELYAVQQMVPHGATVSSIRFLMRLKNAVDPERFCEALNKALAHHPAFAMCFSLDDGFNLSQRYDPVLIPNVEVLDITPETEAALADTLIRPFDVLPDHSLCRVELYRGKNDLYFFMDVHHLLADGLSLRPFLGSIVDAYHGVGLKRDRFPALLSMEEKRMLSGQYEADRAYLLGRYGRYDWCVMPFEESPSCDEKGGEFSHRLCFSKLQLRYAADRLSVSLSVMHIASIILAMYHDTGRKDILTFWTFHNRQTKEAENAVGMFIKTLPVGCHMDAIGSVSELLISVKEQVLSGIAHSMYSYLVEDVFSRGRVWVESNIQVHMNDSRIGIFEPRYVDLHNAYPETADNVVLAVISDSDEKDGALDCKLSCQKKGIRASQVEGLHREIFENLEAMVLGRQIKM
ncbi:MAG: amino acid adenylation domain-containing protein [Lachnospiraceae bacterium]|nr:amino acid adenylation domain-containing protein [Lachnospiraceae bacterium]